MVGRGGPGKRWLVMIVMVMVGHGGVACSLVMIVAPGYGWPWLVVTMVACTWWPWLVVGQDSQSGHKWPWLVMMVAVVMVNRAVTTETTKTFQLEPVLPFGNRRKLKPNRFEN